MSLERARLKIRTLQNSESKVNVGLWLAGISTPHSLAYFSKCICSQDNWRAAIPRDKESATAMHPLRDRETDMHHPWVFFAPRRQQRTRASPAGFSDNTGRTSPDPHTAACNPDTQINVHAPGLADRHREAAVMPACGLRETVGASVWRGCAAGVGGARCTSGGSGGRTVPRLLAGAPVPPLPTLMGEMCE